MKSRIKRCLSAYILPFFILIGFCSPTLAEEQTFQGRVTKVVDGDTIHVTMDNKTRVKVRLAAVDSPEMPWGKMPGQPFAKEATSFMTNLIFQKNVKVVSYGLDRERRNLGFVFLGDLNVNLELVKAGLAEVYRGRGKPVQAHLAELRLAEQEARGSQKGIWILGEKYESPVKYRERMKMKK